MKDLSQPNLASDVIALMSDLLEWQDHIERALKTLDGMYTFNDVVASILRQERHLYLFDGCCIIMEKCVTPGYSMYHCFLAAGTTEAILAAEPTLAKIGKELGCKKLSISGRTGWPRRLKAHGWKHKLSVLHKDIE